MKFHLTNAELASLIVVASRARPEEFTHPENKAIIYKAAAMVAAAGGGTVELEVSI